MTYETNTSELTRKNIPSPRPESHEDIMADRLEREKYFTGPTRRIIDAINLPKKFEDSQISKIRSLTIDSTNPTPEQLGRIDKSFPSGTFLFHSAKTSSVVDILRSGYLMNSAAGGGKRENNGGGEGISWSLSDIEAMPATRYHIAGFVAAPESVLGDSTQLAVPDMAAPFEMVQLSKGIDSEEFYNTYSYARKMEQEYLASQDRNISDMVKLRNRILTQRALLHQLITGQADIRIPIEKLYFVAPREDMDVWAKVMARCGSKPAGAIAYDGDLVKMEDFVQIERGDGDAMTKQLRRVIRPKDTTLRFADIIGTPFDESMRSVNLPHTMDDTYRVGSGRIVVDKNRALRVV